MRVQGARGGDGERPHQALSCEVRASEDVVASICQGERGGAGLGRRGINLWPLRSLETADGLRL